ncbi:hypothetical protein B0J13DRAFT_632981 [Dactylonectria estremocensis]|uniref:RING-type domain-containing protein n=1 Tax=Dactylonectria estremocensis TaxID=1079267 RepID=A0A9P9JHZ1_9HYPO|nr:hypothetical protein B0J13DRAFT_632981 [Dactylonectria estremocensis]
MPRSNPPDPIEVQVPGAAWGWACPCQQCTRNRQSRIPRSSRQCAESRVRRIDTTYWPNLKPLLLENPQNFDRLLIRCPYCLEYMNGRERWSDDDAVRGHQINVAHCGHIAGDSCKDDAFNVLAERETFQCSNCRTPWEYTECKHAYLGRIMPRGAAGIRRWEDEEYGTPNSRRLLGYCRSCAAVWCSRGLAFASKTFMKHVAYDRNTELLGFSVTVNDDLWHSVATWFQNNILLVPRREVPLGPFMKGMVAQTMETLRQYYQENNITLNMEDISIRAHVYEITVVDPATRNWWAPRVWQPDEDKRYDDQGQEIERRHHAQPWSIRRQQQQQQQEEEEEEEEEQQ